MEQQSAKSFRLSRHVPSVERKKKKTAAKEVELAKTHLVKALYKGSTFIVAALAPRTETGTAPEQQLILTPPFQNLRLAQVVEAAEACSSPFAVFSFLFSGPLRSFFCLRSRTHQLRLFLLLI